MKFGPKLNQQLEIKQNFDLYIPQNLKANNQGSKICCRNCIYQMEKILNIEESILIISQKGFGKTALSKKLVEQCLESEKKFFPFFISSENNNLRDIKSILQSQPFCYAEEQILDAQSLIIIIDDFDKYLDENKKIIQRFLNSNYLQKQCKYIYFTQYMFIESIEYEEFIRQQGNLQEFEILQLEKQQVKIYFDNHFKENQIISKINLSKVQNSKILKSQIEKYKNHNNIENILVKLIKLSCIVDDFEQEAGNAMMILKGIKQIIRKQDFSLIRLKNSNFNGISFHHCNFQRSQINNVKITSTWFIKCNLDSVQWNIKRNEKQILICHHQDIKSVSITNDNKLIAAGFGDQQIEIWNIKAGKKVAQYKAHDSCIQCIQFSKDNYILASCCDGGKIKIWNCFIRKKIKEFKYLDQQYNSVRSIAFSADGLFLASGGSDTNIYLRSLKTAKIITIFKGHTDEIQQIQFSPNGKYLASCGCDQSIRIWNIQNQKQEKILGETLDIYSTISFSTDSKYIAAGGQGSKVFIWDINSEQQMQAINSMFVENDKCTQIKSIQFTPDGNFLVFGALNKKIYFYKINQTVPLQNKKKSDLKSEKFEVVYSHELSNEQNISLDCKWKKELPGLSQISALLFMSDGKNIILGSNDGTIKILKTKQIKQQQMRHKSHKNSILSLDCSPVGKILASSGQDGTISIWDCETGKQLNILNTQDRYIYDVKFSNDGEQLASCGNDKKVKLWKVSSGELIFLLKGHKNIVKCLRFSPAQQNILASGSFDKTVILWDIVKKMKINQIECHQIVIEIAYSSCGNILATCGNGLTFWNPCQGTETKKLIGNSELVNTIAFSQDGKILASGSQDEKIILWDVDSGNQIQEIQSLKNSYKLIFSPNSLFLASGNEDSTISFYGVDNGIKILKEHSSPVNCVAFSSDSRILATCSTDCTIMLWDIDENNQSNQFDESRKNKVDRNKGNYSITPLYQYSKDLLLKTNYSSFKNAIILSKNGFNLTQLFLQLGGQR